MRIHLYHADCVAKIRNLPDASIGCVCTDPPYGLTGGNGSNANGYLGSKWDRSTPTTNPEFWTQVHRVLIPDGTVKVFSSTRTAHRVAQAMVAAGFSEPILQAWGYNTGMPVSVSIEKAIDAQVLTGRSNSVALKQAEKLRPVVGHVKRVVSTGRAAGAGESRSGVMANMERWLNYSVQDIPVTTALSSEARTWIGWGTSMRPAWETILVCRKL